MADLSSILGGMVQGFKDFGTGLVDLFGTGGAAIGDAISSIQTGRATTKNQDDFRKWLYNTDSTKDAAAKGLGTALNGVSTVADVIPGAQAVTANPLFNGLQGAIGGISDELKMAGENADWGKAAQRAGVGAASGLASGYAGQALGKSGNKLLSNGLTRGAVSGALGGGIANAGYTGIEGGSVQDMINAGLYGAQTGALVGGTTGLARELMKPNYKMDVALTNEEKAARIANIDDQIGKLDLNTPEGNARYNELMNARNNYANDEMLKLYRGISAPDDTTLQKYIDDMKNPDIEPTNYSGGSAYGKGYYFTPDEGIARYYASESGLPSMAVLEIEVPKNRFTEINKENGNRPADFDLAAIKRGVPEDIRYETGLKDFNKYLDDNGYWGSKTSDDGTYTIMRNDAVLNAKKVGDAPKTVADLMAESKPKTYYHGSPELDITEFDINRAGKNTRSGEKAIYFTDTPEAAEEFAYERIPTDSNFIDKAGKRGGVYEANLDMRNTLDLDNLTDEQIKELWPYASYMGSWQGEDVFARDIKKWRDVKSPQLIKGYLDLEKLANSPYDSFSATMYPNTGNKAKEYAIFDASKAKITKSPKTVADLMLSPDDDIKASYYDGYGSYGDRGYANDALSIGNKDVAPIDAATLPEDYEFYKKITDMNKAKYGYAYDAVMKDTGKSAQKITKADLENYLKDNYPDYYDADKKYTKWELEKDITSAIEDELVDEGYENGADLGSLVHNRYPRAGIKDIYVDHSGKTGALDRELSKRLGIGESTSPLMDVLNNDSGSAAGDVNGRFLGVKHDSWLGGNAEDKLSTMGHERLHLIQNASNGFDYEQVQPVYKELNEALSKAMLTDDELTKVHGKNFGRGHDLEYYKRPVEQEARMLEAYLYDKGYTKGRPYRADEFKSKMNIITPAFDKFFDKLRALSKKGVALPALTALFGGGAIMAATQGDDKKKKSEVK